MVNRAALSCEFLGTLLLVFCAVGATVLAGEYIGAFGTAMAFGLVLLALVCSFGMVSGCHVNPAVTLGMYCAGRLEARTAVRYCAAQFAGGIAGAALLFVVASQVPGLRVREAFGSNGYGSRSAVGINIIGAFLAEVALTFLVVFVVLAVSRGRATLVGSAGLPVGTAFAVAQLVGGPLTGASMNPARSLGPALFAGGAALTQVWLFFAAPLVGGALAAGAHRLTHPSPVPVPLAEPEANAAPARTR